MKALSVMLLLVSMAGSGAAAPPANDAFANPVALASSADLTFSASLADSSYEGLEPESAACDAAGSVWFAWTAPSAGLFVAEPTDNASIFPKAAVFSGTTLKQPAHRRPEMAGPHQPPRDVVPGPPRPGGALGCAFRHAIPAPFRSVSGPSVIPRRTATRHPFRWAPRRRPLGLASPRATSPTTTPRAARNATPRFPAITTGPGPPAPAATASPWKATLCFSTVRPVSSPTASVRASPAIRRKSPAF